MLENKEERAAVGVAVMIRKRVDMVELVLLGRRLGAHGSGTWSFPGGHIKHGETLSTAVRRELAEETGLKVGELRTHPHCPFVNTVFHDEGKHYVTLFFQGQFIGGEPRVLEPDKCSEWHWFDVHYLPSPLFEPVQQLFEFLRARESILEREALLPDWLLHQVGRMPLAAHDPSYIEKLPIPDSEQRDWRAWIHGKADLHPGFQPIPRMDSTPGAVGEFADDPRTGANMKGGLGSKDG